MSVRDVNDPKVVADVDPKKEVQEPGYWEKKAKDARAQREYVEEKKMTDDLRQPAAAPEPPFKVTGAVNLGEIDLQKQAQEREAAGREERKRQDEKVAKAERERDEARGIAHNIELASVQKELSTKIDLLAKQVEAGTVNRKSFSEQAKEITDLSTVLGLVKPDQAAGDATVKIELMRLQMDENRNERDFKRQMKADERNWQIELEKLKVQSQQYADTRADQRRKDEMFAAIPERVGSAIGRAVVEGEAEETGAKGKQQSYRIEAGWGEGGETECPTCHEPVGIGPTAKKAACSSCGTEMSIQRTGEKPSEKT